MGQVLFVEETPEFEYRNGLFHVVRRLGEERIERVMSPHVFMRALRKAAECAREHRFAGATILPFPKKASGGH